MMMKRGCTSLLAAIMMAVVAMTSVAEWQTERPAVSFDRHYLVDPALLPQIKQAGNLGGNAAGQNKVRVTGWFEYDFTIPGDGWYELSMPPATSGYEFFLDGKTYVYGQSRTAKIGSFPLSAGKHTLRVQRWAQFGAIDKLIVREAAAMPEQRMRISVANPFVREAILRQGDTLRLNIEAGELKSPSQLTVLVKEAKSGAEAGRYEVKIPAGEKNFSKLVEVPCGREGSFSISYVCDGRPIAVGELTPVSYHVVDAKLVQRPGEEVKKTLLQEIDCVKENPSYNGGGATRIITKPLGAYRESGDVSWYGHMNSTDPSWFAYNFTVPEDGKPYLVEIDYPDDALRVFCLSVREAKASSYPTTGGVDSGGEFALSGKMQTHSILFWPRSRELRLVAINATNGLRAAISRIRVYQFDNGLPVLKTPTEGGRSFGNWYEEGTSFLAMYGGPNFRSTGIDEYLLCADRWANAVSYMGGDTIWPTLCVYQFGLYPSRYNISFTGPFSTDLAEIILLKCEKYGMKTVFDFHPEGRELGWPPEKGGDPADSYLRNKNGELGKTEGGCPRNNPIHPRTRTWYLGLIDEFVQRYKHSPSFKGISLRESSWVNTCFNNFHSLDWGYDDYTIGEFQKETGVRIPGDNKDAKRFEQRYQWIMANAKEKWITWRCQKINGLYRDIVTLVKKARTDLTVYTNCYGGDPKSSSEAGVDLQQLSKIDGLVIVNSGGYGRRPIGDLKKNRSNFLSAIMNPVRDPKGTSTFLFGSAYFEATEVVIPPELLGFPAGTTRTWMSGVVNPAGRNYLERWALALAEGDASFMSDGGNAYTLGQPLLREFLLEYRSLPAQAFASRADATDPVTVRELKREKDFLFYAVNQLNIPIELSVGFSGELKAVKRLSTGEGVPLRNGGLQLTLQPYQLLAFQAPSGTAIRQVAVTVSESERKKVATQVQWLKQLAADVEAKKSGDRLNPDQRQRLQDVSRQVEAAWGKGWLWHIRSRLEQQTDIFELCNVQPPYLHDIGQPTAPAGAWKAEEMRTHTENSTGVSIVPSENISADWAGERLLVYRGELPLKIKMDVPVDGRYRLVLGYATGDEQGDLEISANGQSLGTLKNLQPDAHGMTAIMPQLASLHRGPATLELKSVQGKRIALSYIDLTPVFNPILSMRWMAVGPFPGAADAVAKSMGEVFPPEEKRDFKAGMPTGNGKTLTWRVLSGFNEFIDLSFGNQCVAGTISYAVTYVYSPSARRVRLSYGVDYWIKMWLNGKVVKEYSERGGGAPNSGESKLDIDLKEGWNELLVKVASGSGGNGFWMAISNNNDLRFNAQPAVTESSEASGKPDKSILDLSFESSLPRGKIGNCFVNPVGNPQYDNSGTKAHGGKGAVALLGDKKYITIGVGALEAGKTYQLSGWFRAERDGAGARLQINWNRSDSTMIKYDIATPKLTTEYQLCTLSVKAPEGTTGALLIIGCSRDETVWLDDLGFGEAPAQAK